MGELNDDGEPHGEGFLSFEDCRYYQGTFLKGKVHGFGTLASPDGRKQYGELKFGKWIGKITCYNTEK